VSSRVSMQPQNPPFGSSRSFPAATAAGSRCNLPAAVVGFTRTNVYRSNVTTKLILRVTLLSCSTRFGFLDEFNPISTIRYRRRPPCRA